MFASGLFFCRRLSEPHKPQSQGICDHRNRAEAHRRCRDHRAEQDSERRIKNAGRNPATNEPIQIKASKKVAFRASKELKESV